jgi:hypothetical protein
MPTRLTEGRWDSFPLWSGVQTRAAAEVWWEKMLVLAASTPPEGERRGEVIRVLGLGYRMRVLGLSPFGGKRDEGPLSLVSLLSNQVLSSKWAMIMSRDDQRNRRGELREWLGLYSKGGEMTYWLAAKSKMVVACAYLYHLRRGGII